MFQIPPNELLSWLSDTRISIVLEDLLLCLAKTRRAFHPTTAFRGILSDSNLAALPEMLAKTGD
jgi:hypothetical protein